MTLAGFSFIVFALFNPFTLAIDSPTPLATDMTKDGSSAIGFTPAPTEPPSFQELRRHIKRQLEPRQAVSNTCGYVSGNWDLPFNCGLGAACAYNYDDEYFGCCPYDSAGVFISSQCPQVVNPYTSCVPYTSAAYCTGICYDYNRVCESTMPYCGTYILLAGSTRYTAYFCSNVRASAALTVLTTWTTTGPATARTTASTTTPPRSITPPITTPNPTTTTSNTITSSPTGPISSHDAHPDHKNVGAIAGGVVGGIVALAGIVGVIIFFLRRKKKSERQQTRLEISQAPH